MFEHETRAETHVCPDCGERLAQERDLLLCKEHGAFFAYGPQLLVRAPRSVGKSSEPALPWENHRARVA